MKTRITTRLNETMPSATNNRTEHRIDLFSPMLMCVANDNKHEKVVVTDNVSANGARFIFSVPLQKGMRLTVQAFDNFSALAVVRHSTKRKDGNWSIGLEFVKRKGDWVVA